MTGRRCCRRLSSLLLAVSVLWAGLIAEAAAQGSVATDRAALEALYDATGGPNWANRTNWKTASPLGEWYGVETDVNGRVTGLGLGDWDQSVRDHVGNGLTGSLPPELGRLDQLRWLTLQGNSLSGSIPPTSGT